MLHLLVTLLSLVLNVSSARVEALTQATYAAAPSDLTLESAREHVLAAIAAERPYVSAEILLALAYVESHYKANARSKGGRYCGVVQATVGKGPGKSGLTCKQLWNLEAGYDAGARHLVEWLKQCHKVPTKARLRCSLRGYGGVAVNGSVEYPDQILCQVKAIKRQLAKADRVGV